MVYIIVFITIAAALGPLLSMLPSKHQRAVADFRERARRVGILVQLREPKNIPARLQRRSDATLVCYSRRLNLGVRGAEPELWVRCRSEWESSSGNPVPTEVQAVTENIDVVLLTEEDIQIFWDERGGETAYGWVERLIQLGIEGQLKSC